MSLISGEIFSGFVGIILGAISAFGIAYRQITRTISSADAKEIYDKAMDVIAEIKKSKEDGILTTAEQLEIADKTLSLLETVVNSLEL